MTTEPTATEKPATDVAVSATELIEAVEPTDAQEAAPDAVEAIVEEPEDAPTGNREAAKYRRQAREAEAERDDATAKLEATRMELSDARTELLRLALQSYVVQTTEDTPGGGSRTTFRTFNADAVSDAGISHDVFDGVSINPERIDAAMRELDTAKPYMFTGGRSESVMGSAESARLTEMLNKAMKPDDGWEKAFKPTN